MNYIIFISAIYLLILIIDINFSTIFTKQIKLIYIHLIPQSEEMAKVRVENVIIMYPTFTCLDMDKK